MTVKELIAELQKIENKDIEVVIRAIGGEYSLDEVDVAKWVTTNGEEIMKCELQ